MAAAEPRTGSRSFRRVPSAFLIVAAIALLFVVHAWALRFTMDDTYISLRYAKNLVEGHGLVFNPGERVEGYSNFLWTLLLAVFLQAGLPAVEVARWVGVALVVAAILVAARFARAVEGRWGTASIITAGLVAGNSALALWATGGLETGLFVFLVTAALERGLAPGVSPRGRLAAPVLFSLASLTRPDGPLLFGLWFAVRVLDLATGRGPTVDVSPGASGERVRRLLLDAALFLAPLVPFVLWKLAYYGEILPNTYYAKAGVSAVYLERGLDYAREFVGTFWFGGAMPLLALLALFFPGRRRLVLSILFVIAGYSAYIVAIGGDVHPAFRFWLPLVPVGSLLVAVGSLTVARFLARGLPPRAAAAIVAAGVLALSATGVRLHWGHFQRDRVATQGLVDAMARLGLWLRARLEPGEAIAITTIGAISYFSERPVIDMLGLTDAEIARRPEYVPGLRDNWKEKKYNAASVLRRRPAVILFSTGVRPSSTAEKALFLYDDFHESYYAIDFRTDPASRGSETLYRLRPDAPPPPATLVPRTDIGFVDDYAAGILAGSPPRPDPERAAALFESAARAAPPVFTGALEWWASVLDERGDPRARELLEAVVARNRYALKAVRRLAYHRLVEGDLTGAEELLQWYREANPDSPVGWEGLAQIARQRGDLEEARRLAETSVRLWSTNVTSLVLLANLDLVTGRAPEAVRHYERALAIRPDLEAARRGLELARAATTPDRGPTSSPAPR